MKQANEAVEAVGGEEGEVASVVVMVVVVVGIVGEGISFVFLFARQEIAEGALAALPGGRNFPAQKRKLVSSRAISLTRSLEQLIYTQLSPMCLFWIRVMISAR